MNKIIVGMGEALWDCLPEGKKIGGAPANFAYHASQFGFDSRVVSAVGADADGDEILDVFARKGLRTQIERVPYPTGTVQVTLDAVGVPCYEIKEGVAWDNIPFTDELKCKSLPTVRKSHSATKETSTRCRPKVEPPHSLLPKRATNVPPYGRRTANK